MSRKYASARTSHCFVSRLQTAISRSLVRSAHENERADRIHAMLPLRIATRFSPESRRSLLLCFQTRVDMFRLQPPQETLFLLKGFFGPIAKFGNDLISRLGKPWHRMGDTSVFFFVRAAATPVVHRHAPALPIAHDIPLNVFVRPQNLAASKTRVAPELRDLVVARENSRRYARPTCVS